MDAGRLADAVVCAYEREELLDRELVFKLSRLAPRQTSPAMRTRSCRGVPSAVSGETGGPVSKTGIGLQYCDNANLSSVS